MIIKSWDNYFPNSLSKVSISSPYSSGIEIDSNYEDGGIIGGKIQSNYFIAQAEVGQTLTGSVNVGTGNVVIDGTNKRIVINDGSNPRIVIGNI